MSHSPSSSFIDTDGIILSTKLDAEKRLALQQEKEALETKLLEVCVPSACYRVFQLIYPSVARR